MINVTIFNEFAHERRDEQVAAVYPDGMHAVLAQALGAETDISVRTATLDQPQHGLAEEVLARTDVLLWWGHIAHDEVDDAVVDRVQARVLEGMGLIVLHSGHYSKIFRRLMGSSCGLTWREDGKKERIWVVDASHPISAGLGAFIDLPQTEMYGEVFDIPEPEALIFISWFEGGEVFRSGCAWHRGRGRIFYFRPGHETYPIYYNKKVQLVLKNAVRWAAFNGNSAARGIGDAVKQEVIN
jgi:trehalose utilization protein